MIDEKVKGLMYSEVADEMVVVQHQDKVRSICRIGAVVGDFVHKGGQQGLDGNSSFRLQDRLQFGAERRTNLLQGSDQVT
jgi:hypothetical protein